MPYVTKNFFTKTEDEVTLLEKKEYQTVFLFQGYSMMYVLIGTICQAFF